GSEHGDGSKEPEEDGAREVEGADAEGPEVAAAVERRRHVVDGEPRAAAAVAVRVERHVDEEAGVAVVPDGLHVEEEGEEEADEDGEELDGQLGLSGDAAADDGVAGGDEDAVGDAAGHERGDEGAEGDGDGGEYGGGHDAVAHGLHRQHGVLPRRLL
ncbi:Os08g0153750, partial [Oryza sativa Japonica Group]